MIQFHLTKALAGDLTHHLDAPCDVIPGAMQWYAHRVTINRRKCVVVMELHTRYAMVFCGLTAPSFKKFPELFIESLIMHVLSLLFEDADVDEELVEALTALMLTVVDEQVYQIGSNRSVQSHISQVVEYLEALIYMDGYPLPLSMDEAFVFAMQANRMLRKRKGDKDYFVPLEEFSDFWFGMLEAISNSHKSTPNKVSGDNVIRVDFGKNN